MSDNDGILLRGLDGSNPLAFLAALGTLRTLSLSPTAGTVRLNWEEQDGAWRPRLSMGGSAKELLSRLSNALVQDRSSHATRFVGEDGEIELLYHNVRNGKGIPPECDQWLGALSNDICPRATSQLQLTRRDYFAGNLDQILASTTQEALYRSLLETWRCDDKLEGQSLHLQPNEDRRHAYQWNKPNGDPNRKKCGNMLGANRLAIEAIPLFLGLPSPNPDRLSVTGWSGVRSDDSRWTWPIWSPGLSLDTVRSLIALEPLQAERLDLRSLRARGITAVYRCRRILVEQTPNLTPAMAIM